MIPDPDNTAVATPAAIAESVATPGAPDPGTRAPPRVSLLGGLRSNLLCGLRLAMFRRITLDRLNVSVEQLIALAAIDLVFSLAFDVASSGLHGRFNIWGLPGALFYLPL